MALALWGTPIAWIGWVNGYSNTVRSSDRDGQSSPLEAAVVMLDQGLEVQGMVWLPG